MYSAVDRWLHKTLLGDRLAMVVFFCGGLFLLWYELSYIAAFNHAGWSTGYLIHVLFVIFIAINIYGNWGMVFLKGSAGKEGMISWDPALPGWRFCAACEVYGPPRSHHCPLCKRCVLCHDHHCWFAGTCVGHANQRYFFALSVHMLIAGIYCNAYNWSFVCSIKEISLGSLVSLVVPHVTALLGQETWFSFWFNSVTMVGMALTLAFAWLFRRQFLQLIRGQTRFERLKGKRHYDQGVKENVREVLGHRRFWVLLWPWLESVLPGDGTTFYGLPLKCN